MTRQFLASLSFSFLMKSVLLNTTGLRGRYEDETKGEYKVILSERDGKKKNPWNRTPVIQPVINHYTNRDIRTHEYDLIIWFCCLNIQ